MKNNIVKKCNKITAYLMIAVMCVQCFGGISGRSVIYAEEYINQESDKNEQDNNITNDNEFDEAESTGEDNIFEKNTEEKNVDENDYDAVDSINDDSIEDHSADMSVEMSEDEQISTEMIISKEMPNSIPGDGKIGWNDYSCENGTINDNFTNTIAIRLVEDIVIEGDFNIACPLCLDGHNLTVHGNVTQNSNIYVDGNFSISGDMILKNGNTTFLGGTIRCNENLKVADYSSTKYLTMNSKDDYLYVGGDLTLGKQSNLTAEITAGTVELCGNFIQQCIYESKYVWFGSGYFKMGDESKLMLSGNEKQAIYIGENNTYFETIEVDISNIPIDDNGKYQFGERRIEFSGLENYNNYIDHGCPTIYGYSICEEITSDVIYGSVYYVGEPLVIEKNLNIIGNFISNSDISISTGTLFVSGDLRFQSIDSNGKYGSTDAVFTVEGKASVTICGEYVSESTVDHSGTLTGGTWYLYGGIRQIGESNKNLMFGNNSKVYFQDNALVEYSERHINMDNPSGNPFYNCRIYMSSKSKIIIDNGLWSANGSLFVQYEGELLLGGVYTSSISIKGDARVAVPATIAGGDVYGNLYIDDDVTITSGLSVSKDITVTNGDVILTNGSLRGENVTFVDGSSTRLVMGSKNGCLFCDTFTYGSALESGTINAGYIWCYGDFIVRQTGATNNFVASQSHMVYISGGVDEYAYVDVEGADSMIQTLYLDSGITKLSDRTKVRNIAYGKGQLVAEGVEGYTLEKDEYIEGDLVINSGHMDLNGHNLTVTGNLYVEGGEICLSGGMLDVKDNLYFAYRHWYGDNYFLTSSKARLVMKSNDDMVRVGESIYLYEDSIWLKDAAAGSIYVAGDICERATQSSSYVQMECAKKGDVALVFEGQDDHNITSSSNSGKITLGNLIVRDGKKLISRFDIEVYNKCDLGDSECELKRLYVNKVDYFTVGKLKCDNVFFGGKLTTDVEVDGDVTFSDYVHVSGHSITADEIYINSYTWLDGGCLTAGEKIYINRDLHMNSPMDRIYTKHISISMETPLKNYMTDGIIYVSGDYEDKTSRYDFLPSGNHKVVFCVPENETAKINIGNKDSMLMNVEFQSYVCRYEINRYWKDIANNVTLGYEDNQPPTIPEGIHELSNSSVITLFWNPSTDNTEVDHYEVLRDGEIIATTEDTYYYDCLLPCGKWYSYIIRAVDYVGNVSEDSKSIKSYLYRDKTAPSLKTKLNIKVTGDSFVLNLDNAFYDYTCLDYYIIEKVGGETVRIEAKSVYWGWSPERKHVEFLNHEGDSIYSESGLEYGSKNEYLVRAVDISGNESESYSLTVYPEYKPHAPDDRVSVTSQNGYNMVTIKWVDQYDCCIYTIYRDGEKCDTLCTSWGVDYNYIDTDVEEGNTYTYTVVGYSTQGGTKGDMSKEYSVTTVKDTVKPGIDKFTCSIPGNILNESASFGLTVSDEGGIKRVYVSLAKGEEEQKIIDYTDVKKVFETNKQFQFSIDVDDLLGQYELNVEVEDYCGNITNASKTYVINSGGVLPVKNIRYKTYTTSVTLWWDAAEEAYQYVIEKIGENGCSRIGVTRNCNYTISRLYNESCYTFRIVAYDSNGVRGLPTDGVSVTTEKDTQPPVITSVYPDGTVLGKNKDLLIYYKDNVGVETIYAAYRKSGASEWIVLNNMTYVYGGRSIAWDKSGIESGEYEVLYKVTDTSGNESEEVIRTYNIDTDGPKISGYTIEAHNWEIKLSWDTFTDEDYYRYSLERVEASIYDQESASGKDLYDIRGTVVCADDVGTSFEETISPEKEYVYILKAHDKYGNVSAEAVRGRAIDIDEIPPVITGINPMFTAVGVAVSLSAYGCRDNDMIASYEWDMGNGDIVQGEECQYIYDAPGNYDVTLKVTDRSGNSSSKTTSVLVGADVGRVTVIVTEGGKALKDVDVVACINDKVYHSDSGGRTNSSGQLVFTLPEGTFKLAAYKSGYKAKEAEVEVKKGVATESRIYLEKGDTITADFTTKQLTAEEIEKAGIDTSKIEEQVFQYDIVLKYGNEEIKTVMLSLDREVTVPVNYTYPGTSGGSVESAKPSGNIHIRNVSPDPEKPILIITKTIPVNISWMENVYEIDVTVQNSGTELFVLQDAQAKLLIPEGLRLIESEEGGSDTWEIESLKGGESVDYSWYVAGEKDGSYKLSIELDGTIMPNEYKIHQVLEAKDELVVAAAKGLHLYVMPEKEAYIGENYYVQYCLVNESEQEYHYVKTSFGAFKTDNYITGSKTIISKGENETTTTSINDSGIQYFVPDDAKENARVILQNSDVMTVETLAPGEKIYGTYMFRFDAEGDADAEYYRLLNEFQEEMDTGENGIKVTLMPIAGHLSKTIVKVFMPKSIRLPAKVNYKKEHPVPFVSNNDDKEHDTDTVSVDEPQTETGGEEVKDPIDLTTGAFTVSHSPVAVSGGMDFRFSMFYDSRYTEAVGDLGHGWHHNYEMKLEVGGPVIVLRTTPDNIMYFVESEETSNIISGTAAGDQIILSAQDNVERVYYQAGGADKYVITKRDNAYILTMGTDTYTFDADGVLTGYSDENGRKLFIERDDKALTVTDAATGKKITAYYSEDGRITSVSDPAGNETEFAYDNDCLVTFTAKDGNVLSYAYDENGRILTGSEGQRVYVENTYDSEGRVTSQVSNGDEENKTTFTYKTDEDGTVTAVMKNPDGTTETGMSDVYGNGLMYKNVIGGVRKYTYNDRGDMTDFSDMDGSGRSYSYDDRGNITEIRERTGKVLSYTYDEDNRITSISGNDGTDIRYTYNDKGQRVKVESGNGITAEYTYNEHGQVLMEKSALGTITYGYKDGMLDRLTDYNGNTHTFAYDANGNVTSYTDGAGITTDYEVDMRGNVTKETVHLENGKTTATSYTYDAYGKVLSKTDAAGNKTEYRYNNDDKLVKEIRPDGTSYEYHYDDNGNLTEMVCPDGKTTLNAVYDAAGNTLSVTNLLGGLQNASYSKGNQLLSLTQANGGTIRFTYYDNGLLKSQTDANGNTSTLTYDEAGRLSSVTDGAGAVTKLSYDDSGNLCSVENALGKKTELLYNEYRKIAKAIDNNTNDTLYEYDGSGNCTKVTDAEGGITEFSYDGRNRIISVTKKGEAEDVSLSMTYDNLDNVTSITDGEGNTHRMEYNELSQLVKVYDAKGVLTGQYGYDSLGNCISVTDALGNVIEKSYDAFGNLVKELNKDTGSTVTYAYIGGKYLSAATDALGNSAAYTYDSMGELETVTNPNGGVTTYKHDLNGNVTDEIIGEDYHVRYTYNAQNLADSRVNSRGQKAEYKYDLLGRIIEQKDKAGTISYTYDGNDNVLTVTETVGTAAEAAGAQTVTITRTYDKLNRVTSYDDGRGNTIGYEYDILGNLVTLTYPNGKAVHYTYDKNGNILTDIDWQGRRTTYSYDGNGRLVKTVRADGTVETRTYDKAGRLTEILDKKGSTEVNRQSYAYDSSGNITAVKKLHSGELDFTGVKSVKMTYDKNNRLLSYNGDKVIYDKDGNMIYGPLAGEMTTFVYDCRNRLIQAGDTKYIYDAENNRIGVETKEKKTSYVVNTQPELSQVLQSTETRIGENANKENTITTHYFYGNGLIAQDNGKDYFVYHFNNVGSTMAVTDERGNVVETYDYTAYGELINGQYRDDIPFLYNGQYGVTTDGNGLYYMRARYYNVDIKRFINQDVLIGVLERISSLNRYAYVEGNPVSYLDPFGLERDVYDALHNVMSVLTATASILSLLHVPGSNIISLIVGSADIVLNSVEVYRALKSGDIETAEAYAMAVGGDIVAIVSSVIGIRIDKFYDTIMGFNWGGVEGIIHASHAVKTSMDAYNDMLAGASFVGVVGATIIDLFRKMI